MLDISANIIQGSAVGPVSYVINTGDLATVVQGNRIHKYADDISTAHLYRWWLQETLATAKFPVSYWPIAKH